MSLYLKWTKKGRVPSYQGGKAIPYRRWTPKQHPELCSSGWHACRWEDALAHISDELWVVEYRGNVVSGSDKVVGESLRIVRKVKGINDRTLRLFAADCAEQVLSIFEKARPGDDRPRKAIQAARDYANGKITAAAAADAADDAADAADDAAAAAADAARAAAARAAYAAAADDAAAAAADAARAAAADAARAAYAAAADAAAARADTRDWQLGRLLVHYGGLDPSDFASRVAV